MDKRKDRKGRKETRSKGWFPQRLQRLLALVRKAACLALYQLCSMSPALRRLSTAC